MTIGEQIYHSAMLNTQWILSDSIEFHTSSGPWRSVQNNIVFNVRVNVGRNIRDKVKRHSLRAL